MVAPPGMPHAGDAPLFVYGTLREPGIFAAVTGLAQARFRPLRAVLPHVRVIWSGSDLVPVLIAEKCQWAEGLLIHNIPPAVWRRILYYEGSDYGLRRARVKAGHGRARRDCVVFWPRGSPPPRPRTWQFARWRRAHGRRIATATQSYMDLYGRSTPEQREAVWQAMTGPAA